MEGRASKIVLLSLMTALVILTVVVNYLSTSDLGRNSGVFENKNTSSRPWSQRGNIKDSGITPPGWAFIVWAVIYVYQAAMLAYLWTLVFRTNEDGEHLCVVPGLMPSAAVIAHSASSLVNIAWVFLADRVDSTVWLLVPQTFVIMLMVLTIAVAVAVTYRGLKVAEADGLCRKEFILAVCLWLNSNGLYLGWVTVASFLNVDIAVINMSGWTVDQGDVLSLANVVAVLVAYSTIDLTCLKLHLLFTPYLTAIWALTTSVINNFGAQKAASVISIEAAIGLVLVLVAKAALAVLDCKRKIVQPLQQVPQYKQQQQQQQQDHDDDEADISQVKKSESV